MTGEVAVDGENKPQEITIASKYGEITVDRSTAIFFPRGLLGLPENLHFCITEVPNKDMGQFRLLQSMNDHTLSFVVLPLDIINELIDSDDIDECCQMTDIDKDELLLLLIVSVHKSPERTKVTANVRAPIVIDSDRKLAMQYIFPNNKYDICHTLM